MISYQEALNTVLGAAYTMPAEQVSFTDSLGRILAEDIKSDINMPPFDKSAMDGYACKQEDLKKDLTVIETIQAGKAPEKEIKSGQCAKIMTGAMMPKGADCVIMVEHTKPVSENIIRFKESETKQNICFKAEDVKKNSIVLQKGTLVKPQHIAVMATFGCTMPLVYKKPSVGILSTGSEIIEPQNKPGISQIRNSNGYQLFSQITKAGALPDYLGIVEDSEQATFDAVTKAIKNNDVLILTGGVSMGDFDFVPEILKKAGINIQFQRIAVQPGKPTTFGTNSNTLVFGLPGNPVSSFIQFELLVKPLLAKMMNAKQKYPEKIKLPLKTGYSRTKTERLLFVPAIIEDACISPVEYHGSAHINALTAADVLMAIPVGTEKLNAGDYVDAYYI